MAASVTAVRSGVSASDAIKGLGHYMYYEPAFYSFRIYGIEFWKPEVPLTFSEKPMTLSIYSNLTYLQQDTNDLDEKFFINFEKLNAYYYDTFDEKATCMSEIGCVMKHTSPDERDALVDFYEQMNGERWRFKYNWLSGDPCLN